MPSLGWTTTWHHFCETQPAGQTATLTRRAIFRNMALMTMATVSVMESLTAHTAPTISQKLADYQDHPHDGRHCAACCMFDPGHPDRCTMIEGVIAPNGWCKYYKAGPADTCS